MAISKIIKSNFNILAAKTMYDYLKNTSSGDFFYTSVGYANDSEYATYISPHANDNDSDTTEFYGGADSDFGPKDSVFYSQGNISLHKVYPGSVTRCIKRINWSQGKIFPAFPSATSYCMTKEYVSGTTRINVYKCLFSPTTESTFMPTGTSSSEFSSSDGYIWKYLYSISNSESIRFLTSDWMPVPEKVTSAEVQYLQTGTTRYDLYTTQQNAVLGEVFGFTADSDVLSPLVLTTLNVTAKDEGGTPTQEFKASFTFDPINNTTIPTFIQKGTGYKGPIKFVDTADGVTEIPGIFASLPPSLGHGSDAPKELSATNVMVVSRNLPDGNMLKVVDNNPFNIVSLISNPIDSGTSGYAENEFYIACKSFETTLAHDFRTGDKLDRASAGIGAAVVTAVDGNRVFYINHVFNTEGKAFVVGEVITDSPTGTKFGTVKSVFDREVIFNSGEYLIVDKKIQALTRSKDQIESFNFVIEF